MTVLTLEEAVGRVEGLTLSDQQLLRSILSDLLYKKKPVRELKAGEDPGALLGAGLTVQVDDPPGFAADPALGKVGRKLCTYLTRRNESEAYYDPDLDRFVDAVRKQLGHLSAPDQTAPVYDDKVKIPPCGNELKQHSVDHKGRKYDRDVHDRQTHEQKHSHPQIDDLRILFRKKQGQDKECKEADFTDADHDPQKEGEHVGQAPSLFFKHRHTVKNQHRRHRQKRRKDQRREGFRCPGRMTSGCRTKKRYSRERRKEQIDTVSEPASVRHNGNAEYPPEDQARNSIFCQSLQISTHYTYSFYSFARADRNRAGCSYPIDRWPWGASSCKHELYPTAYRTKKRQEQTLPPLQP